ncbi:DUF4245 domain-containing protein [Rhodococcus sp. BP-149]|uniref:DUF4245 domain-containing protein n=1 Tax=unclassified Rhodococcus (in: high G+C Gram-positive bacteria) TaxID=192944 RepID=UPI00047FAAEE|nr:MULTISPECIES: DUF4245 domain-containing protein [unclassified Rhodococcus (in: high G+C Gram-positive bacteria)]KQU39544.1 hypothetical protein ASG69_14345 [Rhodococcus sp. Leaf225]KQU43981.1 hypothetical protein ASH03_16020 [Rhodococcus sp. Leaf258]MBY6680802.1 DUF4245 domain-containing protein [Rhodococcus sp. BP-316]MBY6684184.1 DUF4245 domain-containing protein [Rhodococcus sp. BP-288]MBY6693155.1 DUF4245 domain-containing protein [Rhodococcus sp. BP-188]
MADKKPRYLQNNKDMAWSLIPLLLACLVIAAIAGQCSLRVGGPEAGEVPRIDLGASLQADANALTFPVRSPDVPDQWIPNSANRGPVSGSEFQSSTVGFVTENGNFLSLTQSDASEDELVRSKTEGSRVSAGGAEAIAGLNWVVYGNDDTEPYWVADLGDTRAMLTGSGSQEEFVALASATATAPVLDKR